MQVVWDSARKVEIQALGEHGTFSMVTQKDSPKDEVCINGMFVYDMTNKSLKAGHTKTEAYVGVRRRLDSRLRAKAPQEAVRTNASEPTEN